MTMDHGFTLFDTPIGRCAIAWGSCGITAVLLPEASDAVTRARMAQRCPATREMAPPSSVCRVIEAIGAVLSGQSSSDLSGIELDMGGLPDFERRVLMLARSIPPGATLTYGELAARLGSPGAARAVGRALGRNPFAIVVPCHRVLAAGGKPGGFSAPGGTATKLRLLALEARPSRYSFAPATSEAS